MAAGTTDAAAVPAAPAPAVVSVTLASLFITFLIIGATSFGGGIIAYLRNSLVTQKAWLTDVEFMELVSISNTLPGLNATNMAILVGTRLGGVLGAILALLGMCLTSFVFMVVAGLLYGAHGNHPLVIAALKGSAAAAVGLLAATWYQLGRKSVRDIFDAVVIIIAIVAINDLKFSVPVTLLGIGALAIYHHRPGAKPRIEPETTWINFLH
jgi:chromate transporter